MSRPVVIIAALSTLASAEEKTTYDDQVFPIFQQACLNCHNPDKAKGGLDLSSFSATIKGGSGGKIVEPGDITGPLVVAVLQTGEKKMPPEGDKLSGEQIAILKRWIEGGLLENKSSAARKASKPKFEMALRSDPAAKPDGPPPMPEHLLLEPPVLTSRASAIHAIAASPWAPLLAVTGEHQVLLHDTASLELVGVLPFPEGNPVSLAFTPDARYLIVGGGVPGKSGLTITFDIRTGARTLNVAKEFDSILAADIRPGFDLVATGGPSRLLKIWNTETGELVHSIKKHTDWITSLDVSGDGVLVASGDRNGGVWVWESESGSEYQTLRGHQSAITSAVFRADSDLLATASEDGTVRFWEMNGGSEVKKIDAHPGGVTAFSFGPKGSSVTAGRDLKARFWNPDFSPARELAKDLPALPTAVALDFTESRAFIADSQGTIHAYQTSDGKRIGEFQSNPPAIATRVGTLTAQVEDETRRVSAAENRAAEAAQARDEARQAVAVAETAAQVAAELSEAAAEGALQSPNDGAAKIAADTLGRVEPAQKAVLSQRAALATAEKSAQEARAVSDAAKQSLRTLSAALKRWTAAAINTRSLTARQDADQAAIALEESQTDFTQVAVAVEQQATNLRIKRQELSELIDLSESSGLSPELVAELAATRAAVEIRLRQAADSLQEVEAEAILQRDSIEQAAPLVIGKATESTTLRADYLKALE